MTAKSEKYPGYTRAVTDVQTFIRAVSPPGSIGAGLVPDGIYGKRTADSVREFQKESGLIPTGKVDYETWQALTDEYRTVCFECAPSAGINPFEVPLFGGNLKRGDKTDTVIIIKTVLGCIGLEYRFAEGMCITDEFDGKLEKAVITFQNTHALEATGEIDKKTWECLAGEYNRYVTKNH